MVRALTLWLGGDDAAILMKLQDSFTDIIRFFTQPVARPLGFWSSSLGFGND